MSKSELKRKFMEYDRDGNGSVTADEAESVLSAVLGYDKSMTRRLMRSYDKNNDGKLSYDEFVDFYGKVKDKRADLEKAFKDMDKDGNGYISLEEARQGLKPGLTDTDIKNLFTLHDANNDGKLQFEEFRAFWVQKA